MTTLGTFNYDELFSGDFEIVTDSVTAGADLTRGTVVGIVTASGKAVAVDSGATDGSEKPYAVLAEDVSADGSAAVYLTGEFNAEKLTFGGTDTVDTHKKALRELSIFVK